MSLTLIMPDNPAFCKCRRGEEVAAQLNAESVATDHGSVNTPLRTKNRQDGTSILDSRLCSHSGYGFCCFDLSGISNPNYTHWNLNMTPTL